MLKPIYYLLPLLVAFPALVYVITHSGESVGIAILGEGLALTVLSIALQHNLLAPLKIINNWIHQIQSGNLNEPAGLPASGPAAQMADALRSMTASLRETRLRNQETTQSAINSLPHAVAVLSAEGKIELVNRVAQDLFGLTAGQSVPPAAQKWLLSLVEKASQLKQPVEPRGYESALQVFDKGRELFFLPHAIPILDTDGRIVGTTILLVDATQLRQIDEAKSGLLASVSHELKTPLTSIQMSLHLLVEDAPPALSPKQMELLKAACDDADRLHQLIQNLLDAGRQSSSPQ